MLGRMVDDLFKSLSTCIGKGQWQKDIEHGDSSSALFLACVEECIVKEEVSGLNSDLFLKLNEIFVNNLVRV